MGTSGAYGGSGRQDWRTVRELFEQLGTDEDANGKATPGPSAGESKRILSRAPHRSSRSASW